MCLYVCHMCAGILEGQKKMLGHLELEVRCHEEAGSQAWLPCKSSKLS